MNRATARTLLTILLYVGVVVFLMPYFLDRARHGPRLMLLGGAIAVVCGMWRCYLQDE